MKDTRLKYVEVLGAFTSRATEIDLYCKQSQRICEMMAKRLAKVKPKTPEAFERVEEMKDFILKTSKNNEATVELLKYIRGFLIDVIEDSKVLIDGAILRDKLEIQSTTIELLMQTQNKLVNDFFPGHKANS